MAGGVPSTSGGIPTHNLQDEHTELVFKKTFVHYISDGTDATGYNNTTGLFDEGWSYIPYQSFNMTMTARDKLALKAKYGKFRVKSFGFKLKRYWPLADTSRTVASYTTIYTTIAQRVALSFWTDKDHMMPKPRTIATNTYAPLFNVNNNGRTPLMMGANGQSGALLNRCCWQTVAGIGANEGGVLPFNTMSIYDTGDVTYIEPGLEHEYSWHASGDDTKRWYLFANGTIDGQPAGDAFETTQSQWGAEVETQSGTNWAYRNPPKHCYVRVDPIYGGDDSAIILTGKVLIEYTCVIEVAGKNLFNAMAWGPSSLGLPAATADAQANGPAITAVNTLNLFQYNQEQALQFNATDPYRIYQQATSDPINGFATTHTESGQTITTTIITAPDHSKSRRLDIHDSGTNE